MRGGHLPWVPTRSLVCAAAGAMTRKNRQFDRQFGRQFDRQFGAASASKRAMSTPTPAAAFSRKQPAVDLQYGGGTAASPLGWRERREHPAPRRGPALPSTVCGLLGRTVTW